MHRPSILIVEDEPGLLAALSWSFAREGFDVQLARDGPDGLRRARSSPPDVVVLDVMLPGLSGLDVCRELRVGAPTRDLPVVLVSARGRDADRAAGYTAGADDYVPKPFGNKALVARVRAVLARRPGREAGPAGEPGVEHPEGRSETPGAAGTQAGGE